ncbi:MAG: Ca2+:H+ antiporter [Solirubrobacteraceae bacterium]|jgi:Ca2+:H+ antiporter|nr:Ca2+:H+ antiporter [Solirubrobacteraceae bacterium]MEA2355170.1 Ca2+:H+ antiporter [Solirubrobacteraceae bacterium]
MLPPVTSSPAGRDPLGFLKPTAERWPLLLCPLIPIAVVLALVGAPDVLVFACSAIGVIPPAALMGRATEELAARSGPGIGGLLNVTFGNAPELIIAIFALASGLHEVVKASLVGSILGNIFLVLGASMLAGGLRRDRQEFSGAAATAQSSALMLAVAAVALPAVYVLAHGDGLPPAAAELVDYGGGVEQLSLAIAGVLVVGYAALLLFSLKTHRELFNPPGHEAEATWTARRAVGMLGLAGLAVAGMSEVLVHSITGAARSAGLSQFFIGAVIVAIVGNAAEHWVAVSVAAKNQVDLAVNIAIGSSSQIALFAIPVLVLLSPFVGPHPMALVLNGYELAALVLAILISVQVTSRGKSTWLDGVQLLALYVVTALTFAFA